MIGSLVRSEAVRSFVETIEERFPPLRTWHRYEYVSHFYRAGPNQKLQHGVYASHAEALAHTHKDIPNSHYPPEVAARYNGDVGRVWPSDYPVIFWLSRLLGPADTMFDLGGNLGASYYSFRDYLGTTAQRRWINYDVPAVIALARRTVDTSGSPGLEFTDDFQAASGANVLLAAGVLALLEKPLSEMLESLAKPPHYVIINRVPMTKRPSYYTLQNNGSAIYPYWIQNRDEFVAAMAELGYRVIDEWENPDFQCLIPFHPEHFVRAYSGICFGRGDQGKKPRISLTSGNAEEPAPSNSGSAEPSK